MKAYYTNNWVFSTSPTAGEKEGTYLVRHKYFKISYRDYGMELYLRVNKNAEFKSKSGTVTNGDVTISVSHFPFSDTNYINIIHNVTNKGNISHVVDFRIFSDIAIEANDGSDGNQCPERNIEGNKGVEYINHNRIARFLLRDFPNITTVDTYSYWNCPGAG